jgi:DNA-binding XRE family transcriptional regulator
LLFAFGVDDCGFAEGGRRDEIANAHALLLCGFDDFLRLFWGVVGEDGPSPHDAHPAAHDRLFLVHEPILAKCIPGERLSRMREHWKAMRTSCRRGRAGVSGRRIRERRGFDMSQAEFARRIHVAQSYLSALERGEI